MGSDSNPSSSEYDLRIRNSRPAECALYHLKCWFIRQLSIVATNSHASIYFGIPLLDFNERAFRDDNGG
jgi:hypothetical protein